MPIKLPKGFARRKSSGNALEEVQPPVEPSFRVFERPHGPSKSFDGSSALQRMSGSHREASLDDPYPDNIFAGIERPSTGSQYVPDPQPARTRAGKLTGSTGSGGTNNSSSTGRLYDSSSSAKFSSSSTLPSDNSTHDITVPPIPESSFASALRAAGRTFSFGTKPPKIVPPNQTTPRQSHSMARERAMTASTTSTATPPRLLESDLNLVPPKGKHPNGSSLLSPIRIDRPSNSIPTPSPSDSQTSRDGLMGSASPEGRTSTSSNNSHHNTVRFSDERNRNVNEYSHLGGRNLTSNTNASYTNGSLSSSNATLTPNRPPMPTFMVESPRAPADPEVSSMYGSDKDFTTVPLNHRAPQSMSSIRPIGSKQNEQSLCAEASLAARYEEVAMKNDEKPKKVMTPAQFERYREQQELTRQQNNDSDSDSSDHESEEEEDEAEKKRQAANQRKKQEAHLSVYRQQMMKITGEQMKVPNLETKRESLEAATPPANANRQSVLIPEPTPNAKSTDGDDDDDVPLAILAAHGFPSRNRPPSQLMTSSSNPNLRSSYIASPPSVVGELPPKRKTLPVFARNLPQDPYYGAGLVNQPQRESLALGGGTPSVHGGQTPAMPPGGLVGMIANEERARAMRRGSPNAHVSFDMPNTTSAMNQLNLGGMSSGLISQIGAPHNAPAPPDQSQIQLTQTDDPNDANADSVDATNDADAKSATSTYANDQSKSLAASWAKPASYVHVIKPQCISTWSTSGRSENTEYA
ncbi:predicted protein [Uncinocarpus reesii 1704]|uniref:Uncharacterized protein n=1 Tax=Uncinocarpus reesii (strain UAMH 1704) TaxID=336963 RepID=C4K044_UNCRE|nr:uncharacterized protein UREG_07795 [Uncinocarpus reesii 1704]EEP82930.1 predicted protein [Uncinocarpus reesii 1704]